MNLPPAFKGSRSPIAVSMAVAAVLFYVICWNFILKSPTDELFELRKTRELETRKSVILAKILLYEGKMHQHKPRFSRSSEPSWLVEEVSSIASETGLDIETLSPQPPQVNNEFMTIRLNLDARADYHSIGQFLNRLESHKIFINVQFLQASTLQFDKNRKSASSIRLTMSLSVLYPVKGVLK